MKIGIVGAGLVGQLLACLLRRKSYDVTIITAANKQAHGSAVYAAAGMLTPLVELEQASSLIYQLGMRSIARWKELLPTFSKKVFSQFNGSILTAHQDDRAELQRFINRVISKQNNNDFPSMIPVPLHDIEPELSLKTGFYFPMDGHIASRSLIAAISHELDRSGVAWHTNTWATSITPGRVLTKHHKYDFDYVFDCRGYSAKSSFPDIRGVRGELLYVHAPDVCLIHPIRLLTPRYPIYIVPLPNATYIIGASEIESEDLSSISVRSCLELLTATYSIHSGFAEARIIETVTGIRPALPSNLPQINYQAGLIAINGLYRHGFLLAPVMVDDAIALLEKGGGGLHYPGSKHPVSRGQAA